MSDKIYLGNKLGDFETSESLSPISCVILKVDGETEFVAGDDSGRTIEKTCAWGTQAMADSILAALRGVNYMPFDGRNALLDPAAEIGDTITVSGHSGTLVGIGRQLDRLCEADVFAPGADELEDEFFYKPREQRELDRVLKQAYSRITKTADQIMLEVARVDKSVASLAVTADAIVGRVESVEDGFAEIALTIDGLTVTDDNGTTRIKGNSIETDSLYVKAANIRGTLTAGELQGDIIYLYDDDGRKVAKFKVNAAQTADYKLDITADAIAITTTDAGAYVFLGNADGAYFQLAGTRAYFGAHVRPDSDGGYDLGGSSYRWGNIYAANDIIQTSDKKKKKNISYTLDKFDIFFDGLLPGTYQMIDGKRDHVGLVAQDIEENLEKCGISTNEFAGFVKAEREDGNGYDYGLRYGEFVALLIDQVQKLKARVNTLEGNNGSKKSA